MKDCWSETKNYKGTFLIVFFNLRKCIPNLKLLDLLTFEQQNSILLIY